MSILIKGINVHHGACWECPCLDGEYGNCNVLEKDAHYISDDERPLIELHDPVKHGEWIPCSESLPERMKVVLMCFKEGRDCPHYKIQVGSLGTHDVEDKNFIKTGEVLVWYTDRYYYQFDKVIAWMPLPEPYKERIEE